MFRHDTTLTQGGPAATSKGLTMLWLFFDLVRGLSSPEGINLIFAVLCLTAALGADGRVVMALSALLYLWLAFH